MWRRQFACSWLMLAAAVIGCGPARDAGSATPKQADLEDSFAFNAQVARILPLFDDYANILKASAKEVSKIVDNDSALAAGKTLKKNAERIRELAKEVKSVGKLRHRQDDHLAARYAAISKAGVEWTKAALEWNRIWASGKLSAGVVKELTAELSEFSNAMAAFPMDLH